MTKPLLILPIGTQVVTRVQAKRWQGELCPPGTVGVITEVPLDGTHSYTVRLPDGSHLRLRRDQMQTHRTRLTENLDACADAFELSNMQQCIIYRCVIGSQAYGLNRDDSDVDRRGIYLPPAYMQWSLFGVPEQIENDATQECYWEIQKFLRMALKANPNILECLYSPIVEFCHPIAEELVAMRSSFITKGIYQTYNGYVLSQFKRLEQDLRTTGDLKWKHAMHLIRLLIAGIGALRTGEISVGAGAHRDRLLSIRLGNETWESVNNWRLALHKDFEDAYVTTSLPELPDFARTNDFLIRARQWATDHKWGNT